MSHNGSASAAWNQKQPPGLRNRACTECRRKKIRCDMERPICSLCARTSGNCIYPNRRKPRERRRKAPIGQSDREPLSEVSLMETLDSDLSSYFLSSSLDIGETMDFDSIIQNAAMEVPYDDEIEKQLYIPGQHGDGSSLLSPDVFNSGKILMDRDYQGREPRGGLLTNLPSQQGHSYNMSSLLKPWSPSQQRIGTSLGVSPPLAQHLVAVFFEKIQCAIPLLHRPSFDHKFSYQNSWLEAETLNAEDALVLNAIFALSSRFATFGFPPLLPASERGKPFAEAARKIILSNFNNFDQFDSDMPQLKCLQGCILLSYYLLTSTAGSQSWMMTGLCCRMAYEMDLDTTDSTPLPPGDVETWLRREELRRAWWAIWELDGVASSLSRRPFSINRYSMAVNLPVSDEKWFANMVTDSTPLGNDPLSAWKALRNSANVDERAWYLASKALLKQASEIQSTDFRSSEREEVWNALEHVRLALPKSFDLFSVNFETANFAAVNWIINIHLVLETTAIMLCLREPASAPGLVNWPIENKTIAVDSCAHHVQAIVRIAQMWKPEYIKFSLPFAANLLFGPAGINIRSDIMQRLGSDPDTIKITLGQFANSWGLYESLLYILSLHEKQDPSVTESTNTLFDKGLIKRFATLMPERVFKIL